MIDWNGMGPKGSLRNKQFEMYFIVATSGLYVCDMADIVQDVFAYFSHSMEAIRFAYLAVYW